LENGLYAYSHLRFVYFSSSPKLLLFLRAIAEYDRSSS
jgi:hypothetical protein